MPARVGLLLAESGREADGIRDYTVRLVEALQEAGVEASLHLWHDSRSVADLDAVVLQYNPFSFGRRGFAPRLPAWLLRVRSGSIRPKLAVMFHETYVDMKDFRWMLMGGWQRAQLVAVQSAVDVQFCSIQRWSERLERTTWGPRRVHHLPVASTLPDVRPERADARARLGISDGTVVLATLGLSHPGRLPDHVLPAALRAGEVAERVLVLDLGYGSRGKQELARNVTLVSTGFLAERELARHYAIADLFLAAYADGVSTRRTTVMAALQHAIAVVGTDGHLTDDLFRHEASLTLTPVDRPDLFGEAVATLAADGDTRRSLGSGGRRTYEQRFDWPVLSRKMIRYLDV